MLKKFLRKDEGNHITEYTTYKNTLICECIKKVQYLIYQKKINHKLKIIIID